MYDQASLKHYDNFTVKSWSDSKQIVPQTAADFFFGDGSGKLPKSIKPFEIDGIHDTYTLVIINLYKELVS